MKFDLSKLHDINQFDEYSKKLKDGEKKVELTEPRETRSKRQNRALHLYFTFISDELNEMGTEFAYSGVSGKELSMPYSPVIVKSFFWKPIQKTLFEIESTTKIDTEQINKIIDIVNKFFSEKGVTITFPSYESLVAQSLTESTYF